ncbi:MAG TPA: peptide chain release factor N(5)-glutamine methyltransferase [Steroidobacteraceae bacterium]|jgi:release factor glutamine methyltransferase|nr:peptide chain release factor N(5)-glutamine methyltransferase [Steroidobacteraceae bacterium]
MSDNLTDRASPRALRAWLERGHRQLQAAGRASARLEAELLLAHVLGRPRSYLLTHAEQPLAPEPAARYGSMLERAVDGEPLAYLTGEREFWSLTLTVSSAVLIPRPETELAVERCLALLADAGPAPRVCDLGTGAGSIALALAAERPHWRITATDLSSAALEIARANARRLGLPQVEFLLGDWLAPLAGREFELIVSNPPYVGMHDPALDALRHEPRSALTPGTTGLEALHRLIPAARAHLTRGGWLVLEHGADQRVAVAAALVEAGYARVRCHCDLAGHDRISEGQRL